MAQKTVHQFSAPSSSHIPIGLSNYQGNEGFELKTGLLNMVQAKMFPFSLLGKAKMWFYTNKDAFINWEAYSNAFLAKYFLVGRTNAFRNRISSYQQL